MISTYLLMRAHHESYDVIINSSVSVYFFNALKATLSLQDDAIIKEGVNVDERKDHECQNSGARGAIKRKLLKFCGVIYCRCI